LAKVLAPVAGPQPRRDFAGHRPALKGGTVRIIVKPSLLILFLTGFLPLAAGHKESTVTKYFTNFGSNTVTVIVETSSADKGKNKVNSVEEKDILPGARNVAIVIHGKNLYQIEFDMVSKLHPDKTFGKGQGINRNKYFAIDDDMMVDMQNDPFN
jgi:hypothetical protein